MRKKGVAKRTRNTVLDPFSGYVKIKAPDVFSFIKEPEKVSGFIGKLKNQFKQNKKVFVVLRDVEIIDYSAIVVLLSIMVRFKAKNLQFNGDFPRNQLAAEIIKRSGFFEKLEIGENDRFQITPKKGDGIFTHSWKRVDPQLTARLIENASITIWGKALRRQGVQRSLIELMQNTHNHADKTSEAIMDWWVSVHHDRESRRVSFSFVDYGIGVFKSLEGKSSGNKFFGWKEKVKEVFTFKNNADLLRKILEGELHRTVTGKPFRGKGLPGIREVMEQNWISNLHVITNDVFANVGAGEFRTLDFPFQGTFIYWEVGAENLEVGEKNG
ncbi:MAG: hypothetical protein KOO63_06810 [Bacteroidales bacterium]|nr:hypothetical protein [Candidatus Latescibacterota bacterium]